MKNKTPFIDRLISFLLFLGLTFGLIFIYFAQERHYNTLVYGNLLLGTERYLRILCVMLVFLVSVLAIFRSKSRYTLNVYAAYVVLLGYITLNYVLYGADIFDTTKLMDTKGIGPWICMGLIFVSQNDGIFKNIKIFLFITVFVIFALSVYNFIDYGVGAYRGEAIAKYLVYAVNMVWIAPYVFLILKNKVKFAKFRFLVLLPGVFLALITQTRSFLLIYFLVLLFDFFHTKKKTLYILFGSILAFGFMALLLSSEALSSSYKLLGKRGLEDSRTSQLVQFTDQINIIELVVGKGPDATWSFSGFAYQHLDNQWMLLLWWGGLIPFLMYFYLTAFIPVKMFLKTDDYETKVESFILILWTLACGGMAIFSTMSVEFYFFVICLIQGRLLHKYSLIK
ncbi:hypothetical protein [Maribacter aestuarii]|uniref:hypothetical protein n=1 Tax=Maribacter aestuarii TaxID=1130723 RepID=UPI00248B045D|nr:hypothetical protein [Maribacter aestuarii]